MAVDGGLEPFKKILKREVTQDDIQRLTELKFIRISRYDTDKADNEIKQIEEDIKQTQGYLDSLKDYTIAYYTRILNKYGKGKERKTELREFDMIEATKVAVTNAKLYVDKAEGFFGVGKSMKESEFVCDCSDIDDVIVMTKDGRYIITKVSDKAFFAKNIYYIGVFKRNDERTIYNILYRDGRMGALMMKRCAIKGVTRDKEYDITKGTAKSEIIYLSVNPNGEAEVLKIYFKPRPRLKKLIAELDFSTLAIKGRQSQGNLYTRYSLHKIVVKERGVSTLAGQNIWYDGDVRRLNTDEHGVLLGEFKGDDKLVVWTAKNQYYITGYDIMQHFPDDTIKVEKYVGGRVYNVCYFDRGQNYFYMKRFELELGDKTQQFLSEDGEDRLICISSNKQAKLVVEYQGAHSSRPADQIEVGDFVGIKSHRAKGKRVSTYDVAKLYFIEPEEVEEEEDEIEDSHDDIDVDVAAVEQPSSGVANDVANGVELSIERNEVDENTNTSQLNLFE